MTDTRMGVGYLQTINGKKVWVLDTGQVLNFQQPPPPPGFNFGVDIAGNDARGYSKAADYTLVTGKLGRDLHSRVKFYGGAGGTIADSVANQNSTGSNEPNPVLCFKAFTNADINAHLAGVTAPEVWVYYQEFQPGDGGQTWAQWNTANGQLQTLKSNHVNGHFVTLQAVNSSSYFNGAPANDWNNIDYTVLDAMGWDTYNAQYPPKTPSHLLDDQIASFNFAKNQNPNIKWYISEWGVSRLQNVGGTLSPMNVSERIGYMQAQLDYMILHGCSGVQYWAVDNTNASPIKDWSVDKAGSEAALAWVLQQLNTYTANT